MVTSPRLRGQRVPLQPKSRIDQAGPISEGVDKNVQDVKTRDNQLRPDLARQQSANGTRDKEDRKGARLAISRLFLAAPVGRCPEELCPEEVRLANILDSWDAPDDDGSMAATTRTLVRAQGVPQIPIGPKPSWLSPAEPEQARPRDLPVCQPAPKRSTQRPALQPATVDNRAGRASDRTSSRPSRSRSLLPSRASTMALDFTIDEHTAILNFDEDTQPLYHDHARTAPLPAMGLERNTDGGGAEPDDVEGAESPVVGRFDGLNDTIQLHRQGKGFIKRGPVSPCDDGVDAHPSDAARRVRFQPSRSKACASPGVDDDGDDAGGGWRSSNAFALAPDTDAAFAVHEDTTLMLGTAMRTATNGGFEIREDTEVAASREGAGGGGGGSFTVREDTEVLQAQYRGAERSSFAVREDTDVMNGRKGLSRSSFAVREDTEVINGFRGDGEFSIREDTEVLQGRHGAVDRSSFAVREDTEVINAHPGGGEFSIREDTEVLQGQHGAVDRSSFAVREDTEVITTRHGPGHNSFAVREDTEVINSRCGGGDFSIREDTAVLQAAGAASAFDVREDTDVLAMGASGGDGGGLDIRPDTEVLDMKCGTAAAAAALGRGLSAEFEVPAGTWGAGAGAGSGSALEAERQVGSQQPQQPGTAGPAAFIVREDTAPAPVSREGSAALGRGRRLREVSARRRLQFGSGDLPGTNVDAAAVPPALAGATRLPSASPLEAAEPDCPAHDEFTVLEETRPAHPATAGVSADDSPSDAAFEIEEDAENAGVHGGSGARAPRPRADGAMLCTLADKPEEVLQWVEDERESGEWECPSPASPMRPTGLGSITPAGSPLRNQSPHRRLPPLSPNNLVPVQRPRSIQAPGIEVATRSRRALQSATDTINPFLDSFTASNLCQLGPLAKVAGVTEVAESELQAFVDAIAAGDEASLPGMTAAPGASLLGRGGYAAVYRATLRATGAAGAAEEAVALKVAAPAAPWEFAAVRALVSRVPHRYSSLFMPARCIFLSHAPAGGPRAGGAQRVALAPKAPAEPASALSVLAMPLGTHGTLLDLINAHKTSGRELGPSLVMYLSLQLVLALHAMQQARMIHTDIKPDNCLLAWPPQLLSGGGGTPRWTAAAADRPGGAWGGGCMQVIDFGRAIDLELLPVGTQFTGSSGTEGMLCPEMLGGKSWHYCHDAFCVAATVHALLLGAYIDVQAAQPLVGGPAAKPVYRPCTAVPASNPRKALWDRVLRALLNCPLPPERPDVTPLISQLSAELEASEAAAPQLWRDMQSAREVVSAYKARREPV